MRLILIHPVNTITDRKYKKRIGEKRKVFTSIGGNAVAHHYITINSVIYNSHIITYFKKINKIKQKMKKKCTHRHLIYPISNDIISPTHVLLNYFFFDFCLFTFFVFLTEFELFILLIFCWERCFVVIGILQIVSL